MNQQDRLALPSDGIRQIPIPPPETPDLSPKPVLQSSTQLQPAIERREPEDGSAYASHRQCPPEPGHLPSPHETPHSSTRTLEHSQQTRIDKQTIYDNV